MKAPFGESQIDGGLLLVAVTGNIAFESPGNT